MNNIKNTRQECVILLHGLARSAHSMDKMAQRLTEQGYKVLNIDYPSRAYPIEQLAEATISDALKQCEGMPVSFVTHSMGGILVRQFLSNHSVKNLNKVSVESTKMDGMNDHIEIPTTHVFMMRNDTVIEQVICYLKQGQFNH